MRRPTVILLLFAATCVGATVPRAAEPSNGSRLATGPGIDAARSFARSRAGDVSFAILDEHGRHVRGLERTARFRSASVVKAMMMVSVLRRAGHRRLTRTERGRLWPMITRSDNAAASAIFAEIGKRGLRRIARVAGMRRFIPAGPVWGLSQITSADQVHFFLQIDRLVPSRHRRYARKLLSSIVKRQRWGIAPVARRKDLKIFFKGGFVPGITHQVALLESKTDGERIALAVLTRNSPSQTYGEETIEGIAARVLR
jgi:beta-lactamase class A